MHVGISSYYFFLLLLLFIIIIIYYYYVYYLFLILPFLVFHFLFTIRKPFSQNSKSKL